MTPIEYQSRLISRLPSVLRDSAWTAGLANAVSVILQRQDDATTQMEPLLRAIEPSGLTADCILFDATSTGAVGVGTVITGATGSGTVIEVTGSTTSGIARMTGIVGTFGRPELLSLTCYLGGTWVSTGQAVCMMDLFNDNAWLDGIGGLVGYIRGNESDTYACSWIKAQIATNSSWGRLQDLYAIGDCLFGSGNTFIDDGGEDQFHIDRVTPLTSAFGTALASTGTVIVEAASVLTVSDADAARCKALLVSAKPAGIKLYLGVHSTPTGFGSAFQLNVTALGTTATPSTWTSFTPYTAGAVVTNVGNTYICLTSGTSGATGPVDYITDETDGSCHWTYASADFYSMELI